MLYSPEVIPQLLFFWVTEWKTHSAETHTCDKENLVAYYAKRISDQLPEGLKLHNLTLRETATSYAEWYAADN